MSKNKSSSRWGCLLGVILVLFLLCIGGVGWAYFSTSKPADPIISIISPENGSTAILHSPVTIEAAGFYDDGMERLELYADGTLVAALDSTLEQGSNPLLFVDSWIPNTVGRHALMIRGYTKDDKVVDSLVILLDVGEQKAEETTSHNIDELPLPEGASTNPTLEEIASSTGISIERLRELNPSLAPNTPIPPGTVINIPRPLPTPPSGSSTPPPPTPRPGTTLSTPQISNLEILSCSQTRISWGDVADEVGYIIYRMGHGESRFVRVSEQPANTTSYTDSIPTAGTYYYQIEARGSGSNRALSPIRNFTSRPECTPAPASGTQNLILSLFTIDTAERFDGLYCYTSVNGSRYERAPRDGVLRANADGLTYNLITQTPNRGTYFLPNTSSTGLITLAVECWGRRGAESLFIGRFSASHASNEWDGRDLLQTAVNPNLLYTSINTTGGYAMRIRYRINQNWISSGAPPFIDPSAIGSVLFPPEFLRPIEGGGIAIPAPTNVRIAQTLRDVCEDVPTSDPTITQRICSTFFSPALRWDWTGHALLDERGLTGYRVIVRVTDTSNPSGRTITTHNWTVTPGSTKNTVVPAFPTSMSCGYRIQIHVQAYIGDQSSPESAPYIINQRPCASSARVRLTFESIRVGPAASRISIINAQAVDNGDICVFCIDQRFEIVGSYWLNNRPNTVYRNLPGLPPIWAWGQCLAAICPNFGDTYSGAQLSRFNSAVILNWVPQPNQSLTIRLSLFDYDIFDDQDPWCTVTRELRARSMIEWQRTVETLVFTDDHGESSCEIQMSARGEANIAVPSGP